MNNPLRPLPQAVNTRALPGLPVRAWDGIRRWLRGGRAVQAPASGLTVRVRRIVDETADIKSFELVSTDGAALPEWHAGAHIDVRVDGETVRQYSLCGTPGERDAYRIAVKKAPDSRGGSRAMHCSVRVGDTLVIGTPRNHFPLVDEARHHVLLAAGIGITPLLAMAQALQARGASTSCITSHARDVATSCREGVCGTCLTGVIAGTPDHRDAFLSDRERRAGDRMMICVSRARSGPLVLDL